MRTIHQGPRAPSPDSQAEYTQAIRPRYLPFFENALAFGGSPYTGLGCILTIHFRIHLAIALQQDHSNSGVAMLGIVWPVSCSVHAAHVSKGEPHQHDEPADDTSNNGHREGDRLCPPHREYDSDQAACERNRPGEERQINRLPLMSRRAAMRSGPTRQP